LRIYQFDIRLLLYLQEQRVITMWVVYYRPDNVSQPWSIMDSYDNKVSAIIKAYQISAECFMIKVINPDGEIIWSD